jgi:DNA-binding IclR family transcriptional regulator
VPRPSPQTTRVVSIVNLLTERAEQGATLTEVARHVEQTPAACVHVLAALASTGFVVRHPEDRRYRIGPALVAPGRVAAARFPALDATRAAMVELSRTIGLPVLAFRRDGSYARLIEIVSELHRPAPSIRIGDVLPIEAPLGAIFVAWSGDASIDTWLGGWGHDADARAALRARLETAREQGFSVELRPPLPFVHELARLLARGQDLRRAERLRTEPPDVALFLVDRLRPAARYDVASVAVPVFRADGVVDLALSVMGFAGAHTGRELLSIADRAAACAHALSNALAAPR